MTESARETEEYGRGYRDGRTGRDPAPPSVAHFSIVRTQRRLLNAYREGYEAGADDRRLAVG
jgi:hypothetical protein